MKPLEEIYGPKFFARRDRLNWRCEIFCNAVNRVLEPKSVIDVGCAIGDYVLYWKNNLNVPAWGIEGSEAVLPYIVTEHVFIYDLRFPVPMAHRADLCTCLEVAEHIEPEYADQFISNLVGFSNHILLSAAPPGAGGHYHVNCQDKSYWIRKMAEHKYEYNVTITTMIKFELKPWRHRKELYHNNLLFFQGEEKK